MGFGKFLLGGLCAVGTVVAAPVVLPAAAAAGAIAAGTAAAAAGTAAAAAGTVAATGAAAAATVGAAGAAAAGTAAATGAAVAGTAAATGAAVAGTVGAAGAAVAGTAGTVGGVLTGTNAGVAAIGAGVGIGANALVQGDKVEKARTEGKKEGYVKASAEYEEKLKELEKEFIKKQQEVEKERLKWSEEREYMEKMISKYKNNNDTLKNSKEELDKILDEALIEIEKKNEYIEYLESCIDVARNADSPEKIIEFNNEVEKTKKELEERKYYCDQLEMLKSA